MSWSVLPRPFRDASERVRRHNNRQRVRLARAHALETERVARARAAYRILGVGVRVFDVLVFLWLVFVLTFGLLRAFHALIGA